MKTYRLTILFAGGLMLCGCFYCHGQLLGRNYQTHNPEISAFIIPVRVTHQTNLAYKLAAKNMVKTSVADFEWSCQTIPQWVMTGISYRSKDNHFYSSQKVTIKPQLDQQKPVEVLVGIEQFFRINNSIVDLWTFNFDGNWFVKDWLFNFSHTERFEQIETTFNVPFGEVLQGHYQNDVSTLSVKRIFKKFFYVKGTISAGELYAQKRSLYKIEMAGKVNHAVGFSFAGEYNQLKPGNISNYEFLFLAISADVHVTRNITASAVSLFNEIDGISASLANVKMCRKGVMATLEYRELRNTHFEKLVASSPFFMSQVLVRIEIDL